MDEVFKLIAAGGGPAAGAILAYYLWKLEPRMKAIEEAIYMQGKIDLLKLAANPHTAPELREVAIQMKDEIEKRQKEAK